MSIIRSYYEQGKIPSKLIDMKEAAFDKHSDIKAEFEHWIEKKEFIVNDCVEVEGYTAKALAEKYPAIGAEGAFSLLIQLRDDPAKAKQRISRGFVVK